MIMPNYCHVSVSLYRWLTLWSWGDRKRLCDLCELLLCAIVDHRITISSLLPPYRRFCVGTNCQFWLLVIVCVHVCVCVCVCGVCVVCVVCLCVCVVCVCVWCVWCLCGVCACVCLWCVCVCVVCLCVCVLTSVGAAHVCGQFKRN